MHLLGLILLIWSYVGVVSLLFSSKSSHTSGSLRQSLLVAAIVWGGGAIALAEALSLFGGLTPSSYLVAFGIVSLLLCILHLRLGVSCGRVLFFGALPHESRPWLYPLVFMVLMIALAGFIALPNTTDALTYHVPRVELWLQQRTVNPFPTADMRQVCFAPGYAYIWLPFRLLSGYHTLFIPQFTGYLLTAVGVSLVAQALGMARREQLISAAWTLTAPMAIVQASGTFNDLQMAFVLIAAFWLFFKAMTTPGRQWLFWGILIGLATAMAMWIKTTSVFYLAPLGVWFLFRFHMKKRFWRLLILTGVLFLLMDTPLWYRNLTHFGTLLGTTPSLVSYNAQKPVSSASIYSNTLRFHGAQAMIPGQPELNQANWWVMQSLHHVVGLPLDKPEQQFEGETYWGFSPTLDEPVVPNAHGWLLVSITGIGLALIRRWQLLGLWIALQGVVVVMGLLLKWQPYAGRFLIAWYALNGPLVAYWAATWPKKLRLIVAGFFIFFGFWVVMCSSPRRMLPGGNFLVTQPHAGLYSYRSNEVNVYENIVKSLEKFHVSKVGFYMDFNEVISPFWIMSRRFNPKPAFVYVRVNPESSSESLTAKSTLHTLQPWLIVTPPFFQEIERFGYSAVTDSASMRLYRK